MGITLQNITKRYQKDVLSDFFGQAARTRPVVLTGPSAAANDIGTYFTWIGKAGQRDRVRTGELKFSVVFQEDRLFGHLTAAENINAVRKEKLGQAQIEELLNTVGLHDIADRYPDELSGGMRRRLAFVRAAAFDGDVFVLDEPFAGLDSAAKELLTAQILKLTETKLVVLIVHNPLPFREASAQVIILG